MGQYYYNSMYLPPALSPEEEKEALTRLKVENEPSARVLLIEHNLRLVQHMVNKFSDTSADSEDLFSIGTRGLMKGIDTFDISKGIKLSTYTSRCIQNEILMYLRKLRKYSYDQSIEEPITTDFEGNELTANDILSDPKDEKALYQSEEIKYASIILSISLNFLSTKRLVIALYRLSGMPQGEIGKRISISQSYVSRIVKSYHERSKEIREFSDELLKLEHSHSQSNNLDFIFFLDDFGKFCLSIHPKFLNPFIAFMATHNNEFETADGTGRIIIRLPNDEISYLFCAELVQYISENTSRLSNINIWDFL